MKKEGYRRKTAFEKKNIGSCSCSPGHGLTRRVDRVWPGHCIGQSFNKPGPVQPTDRSSHRLGSTRHASSSLITMGIVLRSHC
jgi:hypothetical protein